MLSFAGDWSSAVDYGSFLWISVGGKGSSRGISARALLQRRGGKTPAIYQQYGALFFGGRRGGLHARADMGRGRTLSHTSHILSSVWDYHTRQTGTAPSHLASPSRSAPLLCGECQGGIVWHADRLFFCGFFLGDFGHMRYLFTTYHSTSCSVFFGGGDCLPPGSGCHRRHRSHRICDFLFGGIGPFTDHGISIRHRPFPFPLFPHEIGIGVSLLCHGMFVCSHALPPRGLTLIPYCGTIEKTKGGVLCPN